MTTAMGVDRFEALAQPLTRRVRSIAPGATLHVEEESNDYCCVSWRLDDCAERELFIEQPGSAIAPFMLRVGVYFQDAPSVTGEEGATAAALEALTRERAALQALGAHCTFTEGAMTRDDEPFAWSDEDLVDWRHSASDHRDLVWLWDLRDGEPSVAQLDAVLIAMLPVWLGWNSL